MNKYEHAFHQIAKTHCATPPKDTHGTRTMVNGVARAIDMICEAQALLRIASKNLPKSDLVGIELCRRAEMKVQQVEDHIIRSAELKK